MRRGALINITPLLDVLLVLLVVFILAVGVPLRSLPVDPPKTGEGFAATSVQDIHLVLTASGQVLLPDGSLFESPEQIRDKVVVLVADSAVSFEAIVKAVDQLAEHRPLEVRLGGA